MPTVFNGFRPRQLDHDSGAVNNGQIEVVRTRDGPERLADAGGALSVTGEREEKK